MQARKNNLVGVLRDLFLIWRADVMPESRYYRQVFVGAPIADVLVEGFIDLLFRAGDGLVVVDYKTDRPRQAAL